MLIYLQSDTANRVQSSLSSWKKMTFYYIFLQKVENGFEEKACNMGLQSHPHPFLQLNNMLYDIKLFQQTRKCHSLVWMLLGYGLFCSKTLLWDKTRTSFRWGEVIGPGDSLLMFLWTVTFVSTKNLFKIKQFFFFRYIRKLVPIHLASWKSVLLFRMSKICVLLNSYFKGHSCYLSDINMKLCFFKKKTTTCFWSVDKH